MTALGVFHGIRAAAHKVHGSDSLQDLQRELDRKPASLSESVASRREMALDAIRIEDLADLHVVLD